MLESPSKTMLTFLHQPIKSSQKSLVNGHAINKCSMDSGGEAVKPNCVEKCSLLGIYLEFYTETSSILYRLVL